MRPKTIDSPKHQLYWVYGIGIGSLIFFCICLPFLTFIAYLMAFLSEAQESDAITSKIEDLEEADNYYQTIMKDKKVKSISQYKGIAKP